MRKLSWALNEKHAVLCVQHVYIYIGVCVYCSFLCTSSPYHGSGKPSFVAVAEGGGSVTGATSWKSQVETLLNLVWLYSLYVLELAF